MKVSGCRERMVTTVDRHEHAGYLLIGGSIRHRPPGGRYAVKPAKCLYSKTYYCLWRGCHADRLVSVSSVRSCQRSYTNGIVNVHCCSFQLRAGCSTTASGRMISAKSAELNTQRDQGGLDTRSFSLNDLPFCLRGRFTLLFACSGAFWEIENHRTITTL